MNETERVREIDDDYDGVSPSSRFYLWVILNDMDVERMKEVDPREVAEEIDIGQRNSYRYYNLTMEALESRESN